MSWAKLLRESRVTRVPPSKKELDNLRSIVARSLGDVTAPGLSTDARFIMASDAARTLSLIIVRSDGYVRDPSVPTTTPFWDSKLRIRRLRRGQCISTDAE
jgi:hypothetical protein